MDKCRTRTVLFCSCLIFFMLVFCEGDTCLFIPTWTRFSNRFSVGGIEQHISDLSECLIFCRDHSDCLAVDFDTAAASRCWIHTDPENLIGDNNYDGTENQSQFIINRTSCIIPLGDCLLNWKRLPRTHSLHATEYDYWSEYDCFTYCRYTSNCVAADFDIASVPACWIHTSYDDLSYENTYDDSDTAVQYQMNRTCPPPTTTSYQLGQCVGQPLRNSSWCPVGQEIHIVQASYKIHPLCCSSVPDVPDSNSLLEFNVFKLDDSTYIGEIEACEDRDACSVVSKAYEDTAINNEYCSGHVHKTNYVSLVYTCSMKGHTDASTTKSATEFQFPSQMSSSTEGGMGTHQMTYSNQTTAALLSVESNNRDALILGGFGVALGGLAVLVLIAVAVFWYLRRDELKTESSHTAMNPMYNNNSSTISGEYVNNGRYSGQMKGVSTAVVFPDEDAISA